jgi:hypothetical protein
LVVVVVEVVTVPVVVVFVVVVVVDVVVVFVVVVVDARVVVVVLVVDVEVDVVVVRVVDVVELVVVVRVVDVDDVVVVVRVVEVDEVVVLVCVVDVDEDVVVVTVAVVVPQRPSVWGFEILNSALPPFWNAPSRNLTSYESPSATASVTQLDVPGSGGAIDSGPPRSSNTTLIWKALFVDFRRTSLMGPASPARSL